MTVATSRGTVQIPEVEGRVTASNRTELDEAVQTLQDHKGLWLTVGVSERHYIVQRLMEDTAAVAEEWVRVSVEAKGIAATSREVSEEWLGGPLCVLRNLRLLGRSLQDIAKRGRPRIPGQVRVRSDGQVIAPVLPMDVFDRIFYRGFSAEVWMEPGVTAEELPDTQALIYQRFHGEPSTEEPQDGTVALVLGAGNVSSIPPMDALYKLLVEDQVVLLKMNPVNAYLGPILERALAYLVESNFLRIAYGGKEVGSYLCHHRGVETIHITGSDKTHDAIVYGTGVEGARRKAQKTPLLGKPITSELGNVSPVIVVPGPWSDADLAFQGANLASMLTNNAGFNCNATRVVVQHLGWDQRFRLLDAVRSVLKTVPPRRAYYPGAEERFSAFTSAHRNAETYGQGGPGELPWSLIPEIDAARRDDLCFTTEAFCGVFGETALPGASVPEFVDRAVDFANESLWGSLNATLLVHPTSLKDPEVAAAVERAVAHLRYGTVAVNHWAALGYAFTCTTWGAFPGHPPFDIQSGRGVVHNTLMFSRPQKSVLRGPFRVRPTPPWFVTHRNPTALARRLAYFEADPKWRRVPGILGAALSG